MRVWRPGAGTSRIVAVAHNPNNGFANDTLFLTVATTDTGVERLEQLVVRAPPRGDGIYPAPDIERQVRIQSVLSACGAPVVAPLAYEPNPDWIGAPFMVMPRINGRVPPDDPPYAKAGWLYDASEEEQRRLFTSTLEAMAAIHRVDWKKAGAGFLARETGTGLHAELAHWDGYIRWAAGDTLPAAVEEGLAWLKRRLPRADAPDSILWGDSRLGNIIYGPDMRPAAVLDWEIAAIGPAEIDLGYLLAYDRRSRERLSIAADRELPGFMTRNETIDAYSQLLKRDLQDLVWYEVFAVLRLAGFILRVQSLMRRRGVHDHFVMQRPVLQDWCIALMRRIDAG